MNQTKKVNINWRATIAQGIVLSISIYIPFFLQNWYSENQSHELNDQYKDFLIKDVQMDAATIDTMIMANQMYLDTAMSIFVTPCTDSAGLMSRGETALMLGMTDEFYPVSDLDTYLDQFRDHGDASDLKLVRELGYLKISFQKIAMIDKRREDYRKEYYTPIYLNKYSIKNGYPEIIDYEYFESDHFLNSISLLFRLSILTDGIYTSAKEQCKIVLETLKQ